MTLVTQHAGWRLPEVGKLAAEPVPSAHAPVTSPPAVQVPAGPLAPVQVPAAHAPAGPLPPAYRSEMTGAGLGQVPADRAELDR